MMAFHSYRTGIQEISLALSRVERASHNLKPPDCGIFDMLGVHKAFAADRKKLRPLKNAVLARKKLMSYTKQDWKRRIAERGDMCTGLVHLTRETDHLNVGQVLIKILIEKKLTGSTTDKGFICGSRRAVCFQDAPLYSISQNVFFEQKKWEQDKTYKLRYRAFGIAFSKDYLFNKGARPVIYDKTDAAKSFLPKEEWWRIVRLDLSKEDAFIDWTHEREWRLPGDLDFDLTEATIVCINNKGLKVLAAQFNKQTGKELRDEVNGIVTLSDVLY
jgi:hypothetical protein